MLPTEIVWIQYVLLYIIWAIQRGRGGGKAINKIRGVSEQVGRSIVVVLVLIAKIQSVDTGQA